MILKEILSTVAIITAIGVGGTLYLSDKSEAIAETPQVVETKPQQSAIQKKPKSASVVSIPKNPRDGQFWTTGRVNSGYVNFLVDTGASTIALTLNDARKAGIDINALNFSAPVNTANGRTYAAPVRLKSVSLGGITLRDVDAMVLKDGLSTSLLGMTFLGQLQKVEATPNALLLRL